MKANNDDELIKHIPIPIPKTNTNTFLNCVFAFYWLLFNFNNFNKERYLRINTKCLAIYKLFLRNIYLYWVLYKRVLCFMFPVSFILFSYFFFLLLFHKTIVFLFFFFFFLSFLTLNIYLNLSFLPGLGS